MPAGLNPGLTATVQQKAGAPPPGTAGLSFDGMMGGINSNISPFTSSLRDITRNLAAGFAKDPAVRQQYSAQNAVVDESRRREQVAQRQQQIEQLMQNFNTYAEAIRGTGGTVTPGLQKLLDQNVGLLSQIGMDPQQAQMMADAAVSIGSLPQAPEAYSLSPGEARYLGTEKIAEQPAETGPGSTIGKLAADLQAGRITKQEYDIAVQSMMPSSPQTNISIKNPGTVPPDFTAVYDDNNNLLRYDVIPGSETDTARKRAAKQAIDTADIVTEDVDRAIDIISSDDIQIPTTGFVGAGAKNVPGTAAYDLQQLLVGIRSNTSFDKLQQMRQASPTGGALGPVSDLENKKLESVLGSLEQSQGKEQILYNLQRVKKVYKEIVHGSPSGGGTLQTAPPPPPGFELE